MATKCSKHNISVGLRELENGTITVLFNEKKSEVLNIPKLQKISGLPPFFSKFVRANTFIMRYIRNSTSNLCFKPQKILFCVIKLTKTDV